MVVSALRGLQAANDIPYVDMREGYDGRLI